MYIIYAIYVIVVRYLWYGVESTTKRKIYRSCQIFYFWFCKLQFASPPEYPAGSVPVCLCYWTGHITITIIIITIAIIIIKISPIIILKGSPIGLHITPQMVEIVSRERATSVDQLIIPQNAIWWCGMICPCYESSIPGPNWALILIANPHNVIPGWCELSQKYYDLLCHEIRMVTLSIIIKGCLKSNPGALGARSSRDHQFKRCGSSEFFYKSPK